MIRYKDIQGVYKKKLNRFEIALERSEKFLINIDCLGTYDVE